MKDIIIKAERKKKELMVLATCFAIAYILNILGLFIYQTSPIELITMLPFVLKVTLFFYSITWVVRLVFMGIRFLLNLNK